MPLSLPTSPNLTGKLQLNSDLDLWQTLYNNNQPFPPDVDTLVELKFEAGGSGQMKQVGGLAIDIGGAFSSQGSCTIQLFRPEQDLPQDNALDRFGVADLLVPGQLYLVTSLVGNAKGSINGTWPSGALSATFGIQAGGDIAFHQLRRFPAAASVRTIVDDLLSSDGLRLPQSIVAAKQPPAEGEVIALAYCGYLSLSSKISWGYSMARSESFSRKDLASSFDYNLKLSASVALAYRIAGEFSVEVRADGRPGRETWTRIVVRRSRSDAFSFTADLAFEAGYEFKDLADKSFEDVVAATLGIDATSLTKKLDQALALTDPAALRKKLGDMAYAWVSDLVQPVYGKVFDNTNVKELVAKLGSTARKVAGLDQQVAAIFQKHLGAPIDKLEETIDGLLNVDDLAVALGVADNKAWKLLDELFGDRLQKHLHEGAPFKTIKDKLRELKTLVVDGPTSEIAKWLKTAQEKLGIDKLISELAQIKSAADLQQLTDDKLKALVGELVGKAFDQIAQQQAFVQAFAELKKVRDGLKAFREQWKKTIAEVAKQKFTASLAYQYSRSRQEDRLLELSLNLDHPDAAGYFDRAMKGDFVDLMNEEDDDLIELHAGTIEQKAVVSSDLRLHLFGFNLSSLRTITQNSKIALEPGRNGLVALYTSQTMVDQKIAMGTKNWEETQWSNFTLHAAAEVIKDESVDGPRNRTVLNSLSALSMSYSLRFEDTATTFAELEQYLRFCKPLRLGPADYMAQLRTLLGHRKPGKVAISYEVTYDADALLAAFLLQPADVLEIAKQTRREFARSYLLGRGSLKEHGLVGLAYADERFHQRVEYDRKNNLPFNPNKTNMFQGLDVVVPALSDNSIPANMELLAGDQHVRVTMQVRTEVFFLRALEAFDRVMEKATPVDKFDKAARDLLKNKRWADLYLDQEYSPFFAIMDALVAHGSEGRALRKSTVHIKLTPPNETESINQFFSA